MDIGILLWNTCNASCAHCAVSSGPLEKREMSNQQIKEIIDQAIEDSDSPSIGLSGGEAFYFLEDLLEIASYATKKGAKIAINTNCFWAVDAEEARRIVRLLKNAKVTKLVASTDTFHKKYISEECVMNAVEACIEEHLEIEIQFVATKKTERLHQFLARNANHLVNITVREIPAHPVGRSSNISHSTLITQKKIPNGQCPNAVLSVSADGRYIPCCNSAGHLPDLEVGKISESLATVNRRFHSSPVMSFLWAIGPAGLIPAALDAGFKTSALGYVDQCHLCHDLFRTPATAEALKDYTSDWLFNRIYNNYTTSLKSK